MVLGLHAPFEHSQLSSGIERCVRYNLQERRFAQMMRAGARHENAAWAEQFERSPVDLAVTANCRIQATSISSSRSSVITPLPRRVRARQRGAWCISKSMGLIS